MITNYRMNGIETKSSPYRHHYTTLKDFPQEADVKSLLEALQQWSTGIKDGDIAVSNVYVQLGNEFNTAVAAFNACHIDMRYAAQNLT